MKTMLHLSLIKRIAFIAMVFFIYSSCRKDIKKEPTAQEEITSTSNKTHGHLEQTKTFSSDVLQAWINFDLRLLRNNASPNNYIMMEHFAYSSIAVYEAVVPGMPAYQSLAGPIKVYETL